MTVAEGSDRTDAEWARRLSQDDDSGMNLPLVAEVAGEPMGLAWGRIERRVPNVVNIYQMWVHPAHRQRGAGRMLLEAVIAWARAHGAEYLDLGVTCGDSAARRLYERAGFKALGMPEALRPESPLMAQPMRLALYDPLMRAGRDS
jgi:ribosomal protein S18 acetylase RimI-like enzyme